MKLSPLAACLVILASAPAANDIVPGTPGEFVGAAQGLFADPAGVITVNAVTLTADSTTTSCPTFLPDETQFGEATGFAARSGWVLANGYVEDLDDDGLAQGVPGACLTAAGSIGTPGANCTGVDPVLSALLGGSPTEDAAILEVDFDVAVPTTLDVSYNFLTFESPIDVAFYDSFGVVLDGGLVAGGTSNGGPIGPDPWSLTQSPASPHEYQSISPSSTHTVPGFETGRRTVTVLLTAGNHSLSFHVADSGPAASCGGGACNRVQSALFFGLHTFRGPSANGVGSAAGFAPRIDQVGHAAPTMGSGGTFPPDFGVTLSGAAPNAPVFFVQGNGILFPTTIPLLAPREVLIGPFLVISTLSTDAFGFAKFPPTDPTFDTSIVGFRIHFQWWGLDGGGLFNTPGLRVDFGP